MSDYDYQENEWAQYRKDEREEYDRLTTAELFLAAICAGVARWETFSTGQSGEVCVRSMRWAVKLTSRGIPDLDDHPVRVELLRALQEASRG